MVSFINLKGVPVNPRNTLAADATLHCLTGCAIGEIVGLMVGTALGLSTGVTIALAVGLAFLFGYALSTLPLIQAGLGFFAALNVVFAADTLSIATMEITDKPGDGPDPRRHGRRPGQPGLLDRHDDRAHHRLHRGFPVNRYLIDQGKGHAPTHLDHGGADHARQAAHTEKTS